MSGLKVLGIGLILFGIAMMVSGEFTFKEKKKVVDTDVIDISTEQTKTITWAPVAGGIAVVGGIIVLLLERKKKK